MHSEGHRAATVKRDEELMRLFDGERARGEGEVGQADAPAKVRDLELLGELLRDNAADDRRADGIADVVMARLDAEQPADAASTIASLDDRRAAKFAGRRPSNDNARNIFALAALAAAAAAGLFFWGRSGDTGPDLSASADPVAVADATALELAPPLPAVAAVVSEPTLPAAAVSVASVDFGARSGSVFYMSSGAEGDGDAVTAVVWVTDDSAGVRP